MLTDSTCRHSDELDSTCSACLRHKAYMFAIDEYVMTDGAASAFASWFSIHYPCGIENGLGMADAVAEWDAGI